MNCIPRQAGKNILRRSRAHGPVFFLRGTVYVALHDVVCNRPCVGGAGKETIKGGRPIKRKANVRSAPHDFSRRISRRTTNRACSWPQRAQKPPCDGDADILAGWNGSGKPTTVVGKNHPKIQTSRRDEPEI